MRTRLGLLTGLFLLGLSSVTAKKDKPEIEETAFKALPANLFYFEDSDVVLLQEGAPGAVYRSEDAGESWKTVREIPAEEAVEVLRHPFNDKVAITIGLEKKHWITKDQGKTWSSFETKFNPVMGRSPISWHATDPDRIIYMGADCRGWECETKVSKTSREFRAG